VEDCIFNQVLECEGINRIIDAKYVQREIEEATGMTPAELDHVAHELIKRSNSCESNGAAGTSTSPNGRHEVKRSPVYEHLGGKLGSTNT